MDLMEKDPQSINVGSRLRELRMERDMSMRALARESGLSVNALSMIERSRTSPSVSTLYKLSDALGVPITAFFRLEPPRLEIVHRKADERTRIPFTRGVWEGLGGESFIGGVEPLLLTLESGANSGRFPMIHSGHEFVMCLTGKLEYEVVDQRFTLEPGDSLIFAAQLEHRWRNINKSTTKAVIVLSGFEYGESPSEFHITHAVRAEDEQGEQDTSEE